MRMFLQNEWATIPSSPRFSSYGDPFFMSYSTHHSEAEKCVPMTARETKSFPSTPTVYVLRRRSSKVDWATFHNRRPRFYQRELVSDVSQRHRQAIVLAVCMHSPLTQTHIIIWSKFLSYPDVLLSLSLASPRAAVRSIHTGTCGDSCLHNVCEFILNRRLTTAPSRNK